MKEQKCNSNMVESYFYEALKMTLPIEEVEDIRTVVLDDVEIELLLSIIEEHRIQKKKIAEYEIRYFMRYIEKLRWDEEYLVNIYPKVAGVQIQILIEKQSWDEILSISEQIIELLTKNAVLTHLPWFLEHARLAADHLKKRDTENIWRKKQEALKWIYDEAGKNYSVDRIYIWKNYQQKKVYVLSELIKQERKNQGKSQEKLAEEIELDPKTLSRIEVNRHMPKPVTWGNLKALHIVRDSYDTIIETEDYYILELARELARKRMSRDYKAAENILFEIERSISIERKRNQQYIEYNRISLEVVLQKKSWKEVLEPLIKIFELTRPWETEKFRIILLSQQEAKIANFIARIYSEIGQNKESINILEQVLAGYDNSLIAEEFRYIERSLLLEGLANYCELDGQYEKALHYAIKGIELEFRCGRGHMLGSQIMQKYYIQECMGMNTKQCIKNYQMLSQYLSLMSMDDERKKLKQYMTHKFKTIV